MKFKFKEFILMNLGTALLTTGVYFFKIPNRFTIGGVSGVGTVIGTLVPEFTPAASIAVLNILLLFAGFLVLGEETGIKTTICSILFSVETWLLEYLIPIQHPLTNQPFLELVYAILLTAIGSAILFNADASSGGTDIIALILKKRTSINVGKALLYTDFVITISAFFVFGIETGLYSLLGLFAKGFLVDSVVENINISKHFTIITDNPDPITDFIINSLHRGATAVNATGEFTHREKKVIYTLCSRIQAVTLKRKITEFDPRAFVYITTTSDIIGRGFRSV